MSIIEEIKARADAERAQQQSTQQAPVAEPQGGLSAPSDEPMSFIEQLKMQADAENAKEAENQDKDFPYNAKQNREQGSPYPDYVFIRSDNEKEYKKLTPEQKKIHKDYRKSKDEDQLRRLKYLRQEVAGSPAMLASFGHDIYNLGNMIGSAVGLTNPNPYKEEEMPGHKIKKAIAEYTPIDLLKYQPQNETDRIMGAGARLAGAAPVFGTVGSLISGASNAGKAAAASGAMLKAAAGSGTSAAVAGTRGVMPLLGRAASAVEPYSNFLFGAPKTVGQAASMAGMGAAMGSGMQALQENDVDVAPWLLGTLGAFGAYKGGKWALGKLGKLMPEARGAKIAADRIKGVIGEDNIESAIKSLQEGQKTKSTFGYKPTTAELANNEGLSMLEDAYRGSPSHKEISESITSRHASQEAAKQDALTSAKGKGAESSLATQERLLEHEAGEKAARQAKVDEALKEFQEGSSPKDTGKAIREGVESELASRKQKRGIEANDKYAYVRNLDERIPTGRAEAYLDTEIARFGPNSKMRRALQTVRNMFGQEEALNNHGFPRLDNRGRPTMVDQLADRLVSTREEIGDLRDAALKSGNKKLALKYGETLQQLEFDFEVNPKISESWKTYAKESIPVNQIDQDPFFKSILKKTDYRSGNVIPDSGIPKKLVNESESSISVAEKFMGMFGGNESVMKPVRGYINEKVINSILDGCVPDEKKIAAYIRKNEGSFILYPGLETKIANSSNASKFYHQVGDEAFKETTKVYNNMFKSLTEAAPEQVVNRLLTGKDKVQKIDKLLDILKKDETGQGLEGLRRAFVDHASGEATSPIKFTKFYEQHKDALAKVMTDKQMEFMSELNKRYLDKVTVQRQVNPPGTGSQTAQRLRTQKQIEGALERNLPETILDEVLQSSAVTIGAALSHGITGVLAVAPVKAAAKWYRNAVSSSVQKNVQKAMLNPEFAELMLTNMTAKGGQEKAKTLAGEWAKNYIKGYAIEPIVKDREEK